MGIDDDIMKLNYDARGKKWMMAKNMGTAQGPGNYPELEVGKGNTGEFTFVIQNPKNVTFAAEPFVPKVGKPNPGDFKQQLEVIQGGAGHDFMVVKNKNTAKGVYHYELQFSNDTKLDPIITNTGCCRFAYYDEVLWSMIGAGILALSLHAVRYWQARRSVPIA